MSRKTRKYKAQIGRAENIAYYEPGDYYLCKAGRILSRSGTTTETAKDGTRRELTVYRCEDCVGCPYRDACCKAKDSNKPKEVVVCRELAQYRQASFDRITTQEGTLLRMNRSIQSEGSFGQLKNNRGFRRFLTGSNVKVTTELSPLALSQDILKYIAKRNGGRCQTHLLLPQNASKTLNVRTIGELWLASCIAVS